MTLGLRSWRLAMLGLMVGAALLPALAPAADRNSKKLPPGQFNPDDQTVDMFQAMEDGKIDVKLLPKDSKLCKVMIENKTDKPLNVKLPEAFAGVPVLTQIGGGGFGGGGRGGGGQAMGGGMGMGGGGRGGGGMFNVPPERVGKFNVTTVCLEHGKPEPKVHMNYKIVPIEEFTDRVEVHELCRMLGTGRLDQRVAQVAAWHLANDMSWQELAAKELRRASGARRPYFSLQEIQAGMQVVAIATKLAEQNRQSPGEDDKLSKK